MHFKHMSKVSKVPSQRRPAGLLNIMQHRPVQPDIGPSARTLAELAQVIGDEFC